MYKRQGLLLTFLVNKAKSEEEMVGLVLAFTISGAGIATAFHLSLILTCMMIGVTLTNLMRNHIRVFNALNRFTPPIYLFFFTLAGASLHLNVLGKIGVMGIGYVVARSVGKIFGAGMGAKMVGYDDNIVKNIGLSLLPQAGVAIGLSMIAKQQIPELGGTVSTIILGGVFVFEIIGPIAAKIALTRAGEIDKKNMPVLEKATEV